MTGKNIDFFWWYLKDKDHYFLPSSSSLRDIIRSMNYVKYVEHNQVCVCVHGVRTCVCVCV